MPKSSYDCIVIGSGPGGYVAAIRAAQLGKSTAVIERDKIGGRCLNYACIPAKAVLRSADLLSEINEAGDYGINVAGVEVDYAGVQARREKIVNTLTSGVAGLFKKNGIDYIEGDATLTATGAVSVDGEEIAAPTIILATGSIPRPIPGVAFADRIIGTEQAWALRRAARSARRRRRRRLRLRDSLGLRAPRLRRSPARGARARAPHRGRRHLKARRARLQEQGVKVHTGTPVADVKSDGSSVTFSYGEESAEVDYLVIAAGRGADVEGLGLADAGVELDERGLIAVDGALRTSRSGSTRSAISSPGRPSPTRHLMRASSPPRTPPACRRTRSPTSTSPARPSARPTSAPSASPRHRPASRGMTLSSARSPTAPSAAGSSTATAAA